MRILYLFSQIPYPTDTGARIRTFQLLKNLSREHAVTLACFAGGQNVPPAVAEITTSTVLLPGRTSGAAAMMAAAIKTLCNRLPFSVNKYNKRAARKKVARLWQHSDFDLIHVDQPHMAALVRPDWRAPILIHEHNVESQIARRFFENETRPLRRAFLRSQYRRMERFERRLWETYDQVVTVTEQDRDAVLQQIPGKKVSVVENGVDLDYFSFQSRSSNRPALVYVGSMDWLPNEDAVLYFAEKIFPAIQSRWTDASFTVVGRRPSDLVRQLAARPGIEVTGTVEDVRPYLGKATILVVPLRIGGGSRLKILEAMSAGLPVVSTSIGCEGLLVEDRKHLLIADEPTAFADQVIRLTVDQALQKKLGKAGRQLVQERYGWPIMAQNLSAVYHSMISNK